RGVAINGAGLGSATAIRFGGVPASFTVNSATRITAHVPAGARTGPISVTSPAGTGTSAAAFTVLTSLGAAPATVTRGTHVTGTAYHPGSTVTVKWACAALSCPGAPTLGTTTASTGGDFTLGADVPAGATAGTYSVGAMDDGSPAAFARASLLVRPRLSVSPT